MSPLIGSRSARTRATLMAVGTAALTLLAACGADQANDAGSAGADHPAAVVVHTESQSGGSRLLVDQNGRTLYAADQEGAGKDIRCTAGCLRFWFPLTTSNRVVRGEGIAADRLGTVQRPDNGATQVVLDGKPLYTFKLDTTAGMVKGDGFTDDFNGTAFDWHAATVGRRRSTDSPGTASTGDGGSYGY